MKDNQFNHTYFSNTGCEYYPCHKGIEDINCLFCFCPLYSLGSNCGGNFKVLDNGIKDCTNCLIPHQKENYDYIINKLK